LAICGKSMRLVRVEPKKQTKRMDEISTLNDLIRFAYNETEILETVQISKAIEADPLVGSLYKELRVSMDLLDKFAADPSDESVQGIFAYAKSVALN
jgi:hypothetical protein